MSVVRQLKTIRAIMEKLKERPDCAEITGYNKTAIEIFMWGLDRAINRYVSEARRMTRYHRKT